MRKTGIILLTFICFWSLPLLSRNDVPDDPIAAAYEKITGDVLRTLEDEAGYIRKIRDADPNDPAASRVREIKSQLWINFFNKLDSFYDPPLRPDLKPLSAAALSDPKTRSEYEKHLEALRKERKEREDLGRIQFQRKLKDLDRRFSMVAIWYFEISYQTNLEDAKALARSLGGLTNGEREGQFRGELAKFVQLVDGKADDNAKRTIIDAVTGQYVVVSLDDSSLISKSRDGKTLWIADVRRALEGFQIVIGRRRIRFVEVSNGELHVFAGGRDEFRVDKATGALVYLGSN